MNKDLFLLLSVLSVVVLSVMGLAAQTPSGLVNLGPQEPPLPPERDWERLGVSNYELRLLERFYRDQAGIQGYHLAYESGDLNMTGVLVQPYIEEPDPDAPSTQSAGLGTEEEEEEIKCPLIVICHGSSYGVTQPYREIAIEFARRGYVVLAPTFRGRAGLEGRSQGVPELGKGEVLDLLQLVQIGRQLEYVDTQRMGILGFEDGATIALLALERSNVFQAAALVSPTPFSGLPEFGYAGLQVLRARSEELFGRQLSQNELLRELYRRDAFRNVDRITTPLLLILTGDDPSHEDQMYFVANLRHYGIEHRVIEYPTLFRGFLTAYDNGRRPSNWRAAQDGAWREIFSLFDTYLQLPEETAAAE